VWAVHGNLDITRDLSVDAWRRSPGLGPRRIQQPGGHGPEARLGRGTMARLRRLRAGETVLAPDEVVELLRFAGHRREQERDDRDAIDSLTPREREVLQALGAGLDTQAIADQLNISIRTERNHVTRILNKLGVHSQLQAVLLALRYGLIDPHRERYRVLARETPPPSRATKPSRRSSSTRATCSASRRSTAPARSGSMTRSAASRPASAPASPVIDTRGPHLDGFGDPVTTLVMGAGAADVETVIVGGEVINAHGALRMRPNRSQEDDRRTFAAHFEQCGTTSYPVRRHLR
jgi:DNA-binding CsgD family transcriptional regulator